MFGKDLRPAVVRVLWLKLRLADRLRLLVGVSLVVERSFSRIRAEVGVCEDWLRCNEQEDMYMF